MDFITFFHHPLLRVLAVVFQAIFPPCGWSYSSSSIRPTKELFRGEVPCSMARKRLCYEKNLVLFSFLLSFPSSSQPDRRRGRSTLRSRGRSRGSMFRMCVYTLTASRGFFYHPGNHRAQQTLPWFDQKQPTNRRRRRVSLKSKLSEVQQVARGYFHFHHT